MTEHLVNSKMPRTQEQLDKIKEQTKAKILEAAVKLFSVKGYHGTSISDIAKEAGVSKGLAYNYFSSKENMLEAIFSEMMESMFDVIKEMEGTNDPYVKLELLINNSFEYAKSRQEEWRLYMRIMFQPDIVTTGMGMTTEVMAELFATFEKIFRKIGFKNAAVEAKIFSATIDGLMLYYLIDPDNFPIDKVKRLLMKKYSKPEINKYLGITEE